MRFGLGPQAHRVANDHAFLFQLVDAVLHGRARHAQRLRQRRDRHARVVAQEGNQLVIGGIHGVGKRPLQSASIGWHFDKWLAQIAQVAGY